MFKLPFLIKVITSHVDEPRDPQKTARSSSVPRHPPLRRALSVILKVVGTSPWGGRMGVHVLTPTRGCRAGTRGAARELGCQEAPRRLSP